MTEKAAIDAALKANKDHQYALKVYIERLESELKTVDKMIEEVESDEDTEDAADTGLVYVEGAVKPVSVLLPRTLLSEDSSFFEDAQWRKRYEDFTTVNPMKSKEHDALREAVRTENMRIQTLESQSRNQPIDIKAFPPEHFEQNTEGIDWRRVSVKMSSLLPNAIPRTPRECEIRWCGHLHPSINHSSWMPEETEKLWNILTEDGSDKPTRNWEEIAKKLGTNRTPLGCMRHGTARRVHVWTPEADRKLLEAVEIYGQNNWQLVAMAVSEDATAHQCQKRYLDALDPTIKNGPWISEEDEQLRRAIAAFTGQSTTDEGETSGTSGRQSIPWQDVALFVPGRTNNQCREHYQGSILKSKRKQTGKSVGRSAKGKEKASANLEDIQNDDVEGASADVSEHEEEANANITGRHKSRSSTKAKAKGKGRGGPEAATPGAGASQTAAGVRPRPRPRKKQCSTTEPADGEVPTAQSVPTTEQAMKMSGPNIIPSGSASSPASSVRKEDRQNSGKSKARNRTSKTAHSPPRGEANDTDGDNGVPHEETSQGTSDTPAKRRKTRRQSRRGKGEGTISLAETSSRDEPRTGSPGTIENTGVTVTRFQAAEYSGRRRSTRFSKDSS